MSINRKARLVNRLYTIARLLRNAQAPKTKPAPTPTTIPSEPDRKPRRKPFNPPKPAVQPKPKAYGKGKFRIPKPDLTS